MLYQFSSVQSLGRVWLFATPWIAPRQASLSITNSQSLPKLMSIESVMPSNHLILCRLLLLLPSIFPNIRVFSNKSALWIRWPKYWSFNINPSNEHPGLIPFRMDWLDLLAVQGTHKSLLQHHSSNSLVLTPVQFSHSVVSNSLQPHETQQARPPCPSPTPRVYSDPCPLSQWCHLTILSSVVPLSGLCK